MEWFFLTFCMDGKDNQPCGPVNLEEKGRVLMARCLPDIQ